jgi:CubicO group peptidase (beta-lactamase class C family)
MILRYNLLSILFLFYFNSCDKSSIAPETIEDLEVQIEELMEEDNIAALSILIFNKDEIKYENYLGMSDISQNRALEQQDLFLLASVSKTITATALLQLYDQGMFQLEDLINDYLPFSVDVPNQTTKITFKMLLTHTSGIIDGPALDDQYYDGIDSPIALDQFLEDYLVPGGQYYNAADNFATFEPGTSSVYSNTGNALIAILVEEITGISFNDYCKQNIFAPLGMTNTFWRLDEITQQIVQPYDYINGQHEAIGHYTFTDYPNGGLRSNARDLFKFASALAQKGNYNNQQLLKSTTVEAMLTPQIPNLDPNTGLHLFQLYEDNTLWGHDGGEKGVSTIMVFNPSTQVGVLIFTNSGDANLDQIVVDAYNVGLNL